MGDAEREGLQGQSESDGGASGRQEHDRSIAEAGDETSEPAMPTNGFWASPDWLWCRDKKWRPVKSGLVALVNGFSPALGSRRDPRAIRQRLKGYGNAIVIPQAVAFLECIKELLDDSGV